MEELTKELCNEYYQKAKGVCDSPLCVGARRRLVMELVQRCGIPEIWALNITNGYRINDYVKLASLKQNCDYKAVDYDYVEWLAEKEEEEHIKKMVDSDDDLYNEEGG